MKLNCNKNEFQKIIYLAERSTSKNPTLPILSAIFLKASQNRLSISSTNLETGFEASLAAKIDKEGEIAVPAKTLSPLLSTIQDEELTLESSHQNLKVISKSSSTNLKCLASEEFPVLPRIKKENFFQIPSGILVDALRKTCLAAASSFTKPELASIYIFSQQKLPLTFAATDSFRLAEYRTEIKSEPLSLLLPQKSALEVMRIFEDGEEMVEAAFNKNQIYFSTKKIYFTSRLTEGSFPDYQSIIPKSFQTQMLAERSQLVNAIKAASVFSSRLSEVVLKLDPDEELLEIRSSHADTGEHRSLSRGKISGDLLEINFNYHYLLDALQILGSSKIFLGFSGPSKAVLVKEENSNSYLHLVMPMRAV